MLSNHCRISNGTVTNLTDGALLQETLRTLYLCGVLSRVSKQPSGTFRNLWEPSGKLSGTCHCKVPGCTTRKRWYPSHAAMLYFQPFFLLSVPAYTFCSQLLLRRVHVDNAMRRSLGKQNYPTSSVRWPSWLSGGLRMRAHSTNSSWRSSLFPSSVVNIINIYWTIKRNVRVQTCSNNKTTKKKK